MSFRPRHFLIRWVLPLTWRAGAVQKTRVLQEFAQTELDSAWQSIYALERVTNLELRSQLFRHAFEELFHADLFQRVAARKAKATPIIPLTRREPLLEVKADDPSSAVEFFAYLAIGEEEIQSDFDAYQSAIPDEEVQQLFQAIRQDETHHAESSARALHKMVNESGLNLPLIRLRHLGKLAYRRYITLMNKFGLLPMTALLSLAYFLFGSVFARQARARLELPRDRQLEILVRQQKQFLKSLEIEP